MKPPLAHSPKGRILEQLYSDHIRAVVDAAVANATAATAGKGEAAASFVASVSAAAEVHDLGKLNEQNQVVLRKRSNDPLPVRHEDAGIAHLMERDALFSAALVAAHHAGLWEESEEEDKDQQNAGYYLRMPQAFDDTQANLGRYVDAHKQVRPGKIESLQSVQCPLKFGLRVALSCLVDADHGDTARNYGQEVVVKPPEPRWNERIEALDRYIAELGDPENERDALRGEFYRACTKTDPINPWRACDAPVGSGKTLAVMAHLLRAAQVKGLRHIIVVLPYTNIIRQSVKRYREALTLDGEDAQEVVAEHHHQADFASAENRHLATLWRSPITVTTAVQFFETLASHHPSKLRKLHELPRSAVFLDETHACLPPFLWRVTWGWLTDWIDDWQGHIVFGSGSLPAFWNSKHFVPDSSRQIEDLVPDEVRRSMAALEKARLQPRRHKEPLSVDALSDFVTQKPGPRLVILNTVHSTALLAKTMREQGKDVLHLSTALTPTDRGVILKEIEKRLRDAGDLDWTLVATSCVEAGVDLSFRTAVRECASVTSLIQTGGRVRRHLEDWEGELWSVRLVFGEFKEHPSLRRSGEVLDALLDEGAFERMNPNTLILEAWHRELKSGQIEAAERLIETEDAQNHRTLSKEYKVIDSDTALVVIDQGIIDRVRRGDKVFPTELLRGSVQIWATKLKNLPVEALASPGRKNGNELFAWTGTYDRDFLGYMAGAFESQDFLQNGGAVV